jgi:class 3 adenylate cyclase
MGSSIAALLFADIAGYSKLTEPQLKKFMTDVLPDLAKEVVNDFRSDFRELNTWGDAIVCASPDPYQLMKFALKLRDFFRDRHWFGDQFPELRIRIALHAGVVFFGEDPIRQKDGMIGAQVNLAARIEPQVEPGEVWVTEAFFHLIDPRNNFPAAFDKIGKRPLAKAFGEEILYRLLRKSESPRGSTDESDQKKNSPGCG